MLLRPRQRELVSKATKALYTHGNTLAIAPTGAGKTIMLSAILGCLFDRGIRHACVLAHRDELTSQNEDKFKRVNPSLSTSVFNASEKNWNGQVVFAMVQTLSREKNLASLPPIDALVIDEAHHSPANSYMKVIQHAKQLNPDLKLLGMTATPNRGDKKGLSPIFSNVSDQIKVKELIASGHLVPPRTFIMNVGVQEELGKVRKTSLDYDMDAVAKIMNKPPINEAVVQHWKDKAGDRQTVAFCSNIEHAQDVTESFIKAGVAAKMISSNMDDDERAQTLQSYGKGDLQVIVNVAILTEGWDHPPTSCIVLLRPSSYKSTMIQMIGRGLRTIVPDEFPDVIKKDCIVLDFGTSTLIHGSLEQAVKLDSKAPETASTEEEKQCPGCNFFVPPSTIECPICGYIWESEPKEERFIRNNDFQMEEIDLLRKSNFLWYDLYNDKKSYIAPGFEAWSGIFDRNDEYYAVGGKNKKVKLLAIGNAATCFAAANDWLNLHETEDSAHKTKSWLHQPVTEKQLRYLPIKHRFDYGLTRYAASAHITMQFNEAAIHAAIKTKRIYS